MPVVHGTTEVCLSPQVRAAPDQLRQVLYDQLDQIRHLTVVTRKVTDPEIVRRIAACCRAGADARALMESSYVREPAPVPESGLWSRGAGVHADARRCLGALLRSSVDVRLNSFVGPRHANIVLTGRDGLEKVLVTSAYLTPGSLDRNYNWCAVIEDPTVAAAVEEAVHPLFLGETSIPARRIEIRTDNGPNAILDLGPGSLARQTFVEAVHSCRRELCFAFCRITTDSKTLNALSQAVDRGVRVVGVVDGDQSNQPWDAVPLLRQAGVDVRYYPGDRTGAIGRMHLKLAVLDGDGTWLSTANLEDAAEDSFELSLIHPLAPDIAAVLREHVERLHAKASVEPLIPDSERVPGDPTGPIDLQALALGTLGLPSDSFPEDE
ncbi:MAG: phosphodiesterase protein [Actinomycetota bacterium]|nr:phosphodiesterase protein [Actinomycetota bacterium]